MEQKKKEKKSGVCFHCLFCSACKSLFVGNHRWFMLYSFDQGNNWSFGLVSTPLRKWYIFCFNIWIKIFVFLNFSKSKKIPRSPLSCVLAVAKTVSPPCPTVLGKELFPCVSILYIHSVNYTNMQKEKMRPFNWLKGFCTVQKASFAEIKLIFLISAEPVLVSAVCPCCQWIRVSSHLLTEQSYM